MNQWSAIGVPITSSLDISVLSIVLVASVLHGVRTNPIMNGNPLTVSLTSCLRGMLACGRVPSLQLKSSGL
jgi:hypothetical protein